MRFSWTFKRRLAVLSGVVMILQGAGLAQAQFAPISNPSQTYGQKAPVANQNYAQPQTYGQTSAYNQAKPQSFGQAAQPNYGQVAQQVQAPQQSYVQPQQNAVQAQQPRVAYNPTVTQPTVTPGYSQYQPQQTAVQNPLFGQSQQSFSPAPQYTAKAFQDSVGQQPVPAAADLAAPAMNNGPAVPAAGYGNCDSCSTGYNTFAGGCGVGGCCGKGCRRWFGGIYGLLMERDTSNYNIPLAYTTSTANAAPYYPWDTEVVMTSSDVSTGFQGGIELRLGATFGGRLGNACGIGSHGLGYNTFAGGACDGCCSSACCCGPTLAWEVGYWGLPVETSTSIITDVSGDTDRTYGMMPFYGWEHDAGAGYRPLNDYFDYGSPSAPNDVEVRTFTVRRSFSAQNVELNLLRLPVLNGCGCQNACGCGPRYEVTTLVGARFLRFDDDFMFQSDWENTTSSATGTVSYNSEVDNKLYGLQLGCNGACRFGACGRWGLHCNTVFGVFGNSVSAHQWVPGTTRYQGGANGPFDINSSEDDIALLGEMRLGASYQYSCNWRFYGGWRVIGISGVATATDQISTTPVSAGWLDTSGSLILHGLQAGVECTY